MAIIHPTAIVDSSARLGDSVEVGAYSIVEADVEIGSGSVLRPHAIIRRYTSMGEGNYVDSHAVLGGDPQDYKFDQNTVSFLRIGNKNIFREGVTISRATGQDTETRVGNGTYWMVDSHAGHNAVIADRVVMANGAAAAGHTVVGAGAIISAHAGIHQFCWIGDMAIVQGNTAITMHLPPYVIAAVPLNNVIGLNTIGLRRAEHISAEDRTQIKEAFHITYRRGLPMAEAVAQMDEHTDWGAAADVFRQFIRRVSSAQPPRKRGLCPLRSRGRK